MTPLTTSSDFGGPEFLTLTVQKPKHLQLPSTGKLLALTVTKYDWMPDADASDMLWPRLFGSKDHQRSENRSRFHIVERPAIAF